MQKNCVGLSPMAASGLFYSLMMSADWDDEAEIYNNFMQAVRGGNGRLGVSIESTNNTYTPFRLRFVRLDGECDFVAEYASGFSIPPSIKGYAFLGQSTERQRRMAYIVAGKTSDEGVLYFETSVVLQGSVTIEHAVKAFYDAYGRRLDSTPSERLRFIVYANPNV